MFFIKSWFLKLAKIFKRDPNYIPHTHCISCGYKTIMKFRAKLYPDDSDGICVNCGTEWYLYAPAWSIKFGARTLADDWANQLGGDMFATSFPLPKALQPFGNAGEMKTPAMMKAALKLVESKSSKTELMKITDPAPINIFPEDYTECTECGYDHRYDADAATRKHLG